MIRGTTGNYSYTFKEMEKLPDEIADPNQSCLYTSKCVMVGRANLDLPNALSVYLMLSGSVKNLDSGEKD